ncbi:hypothetical protein NC652_005039 [Populus alba x Populus x berolinensis]|nr:hypothetical protein NC652_005039 [Populus alba x Populus x berolinensis]
MRSSRRHKLGIAIIVGGVTPRCPTAHRIRQDSYCTRTPLPPVNSAFNNTQNKTPLVFCERTNRSFLGEKRGEKTTQQPVPAIDVKESTVDPFLVEALQNHIFLTPPRDLAGRRLCCYKDHWCILEGYVATTLCWIVLWSGVIDFIHVFLPGFSLLAKFNLATVAEFFNGFQLQSILERSSLVTGSVISEPALN